MAFLEILLVLHRDLGKREAPQKCNALCGNTRFRYGRTTLKATGNCSKEMNVHWDKSLGYYLVRIYNISVTECCLEAYKRHKYFTYL